MSYAMYSQLDDRWQRIKLGESSTTIGANGCLVCAVASGLADVGVLIDGLPPDPPRFNRWLARGKGFVAPRNATKERNLFVFDSLGPLGVKLVDYIDARSRAAPVEKVQEALSAEDQFVALHVDFTPGGANQQHWVRAVAWHDTDVEIMDPWIKGDVQTSYLMTRYALPSWDGPERAIFRIAVYRNVGAKAAYPTPSLTGSTIVQDELYTYPY